ncbi:restriction endonuclease subunit S [Anaerostipes hadrus]|nr:restriction endonuclease subunit S [Anaerostipes hadrus]
MELTKCKLGELITQRREKNDGSDLPICGVSKDGLIPPKQKDADTSIYNVFYRDDFIFNPARMELNSIAINDMYDRAICSSLYEVFYVHRTDLLLPHYLKLIIRQKWFTRYCEFLGQGSAREYCRFGNISEIEIEFPPIKEQQKIVDYNTAIENRIALKQKINDNLINTTDTIFFKVFLENKPTATISFTDIVQLMGGGTPKTDEDSFWNGNILFFTPKDISRSPFCISTEKHLTNEGLNNCSSRLYPPYTTFVTCRGTVGNLALAGVPMAMNQSCYALKGKNDFPALFVFSFTRYVIATMKKKASGAVFSALVTRDFEMEKVFEPNFEDAILFEKRVEPLFAQILANTNEIQQLLDLQNALLTQLSSR